MKRRKIEDTLLNLGMSSALKGFRYITDVIMLLDTEEWKDSSWLNLYQKVSELNNTKALRVERCIRTALTKTRIQNRNQKIIDYYIGSDNHSNSESIMMLYTRLSKEVAGQNENSTDSDIVINRHELRKLIQEEVAKAIKIYGK